MNIRFAGININIGRDHAPRWADELEGRVIKELRKLMAKIEDKMAELTSVLTEIGTSVNGVQGDVSTLIAKIEELQSGVSDELTEEQLALVDGVLESARAVATRLAALDAANPTTPGGEGEVVQPNPDA
jgi:hypothetical protein